MSAKTPLETVEQLDVAFNRGNLEAILEFYEDGATVVLEPGRLVTGKAALRQAFALILRSRLIARQVKTNVIETGDLALFTSKWSLINTGSDSTIPARVGFATTILRKQPDGGWRIVIDNSWGPAILE